MGEMTGIGWTDATVNFWWGCTKVGPACEFCYAETLDHRYGGAHWGLGVERRKIKGAPALIHKLNDSCGIWQAVHGRRQRVFIQSMSDLFDLEVHPEWFREAWDHIEACTGLTIQIVTKRVSVVEKRLAEVGRTGPWPQHAGLIITVANQAEADRDIPRLLELKKRLCIPWVGLSIEPMLGQIDLSEWIAELDWIICGFESGPMARPGHPKWVRALRDLCELANIPFFFKQWGEWKPISEMSDEEVERLYEPPPRRDPEAVRRCKVKSEVVETDGTISSRFPAGAMTMFKVGQHRSGAMLDGREHREWPI